MRWCHRRKHPELDALLTRTLRGPSGFTSGLCPTRSVHPQGPLFLSGTSREDTKLPQVSPPLQTAGHRPSRECSVSGPDASVSALRICSHGLCAQLCGQGAE